jgi:hypothetical protein
MPGLQRPIQINIHLNSNGEVKVADQSKSQERATMDKLIVQLANRDALDDKQTTKLTGEVVQFARQRLDQGDVSTLKDFLQEAKHMLTPEMRDTLSDELKLHKIFQK